MDINQIYTAAQDNPNSPLVLPMNTQIRNIFISENNESVWRWRNDVQDWTPSGCSSQLICGTGVPSSPPSNQNQFALYCDQATGVLYPWKVSTHIWII